MANWAYTCYAIEGPLEVLQKIKNAIQNPIIHKDEGDDDCWEGGVLRALDITWESKKPDGSGLYMRGFIRPDVEPWYDDSGALRFEAQEAWGATDFNKALEGFFPKIKVFYVVESEEDAVYATNDKEGRYFKDRYYVDTCIDGNYQSDYFVKEEAMWKWLSGLTNGRVTNMEQAVDFNADYEASDAWDENFINIHKLEVID